MPINKNAMIRYQVLDKCLRNTSRKYYIEDLIDACNEALEEYNSKTSGVSRRQIYDDLNYIESTEGFGILIDRIFDGKRKYIRYADPNDSITKKDLNEDEVHKLKESLLILSRFRGLPQFDWIEELVTHLEDKFVLGGSSDSVMGFEQNPFLTGLEHLSPIFTAITNKQVLRIQYETFKGKHEDWTIHPYYLKQYNNRWYLFGKNNSYDNLSHIPLDRIISIEQCNERYVEKDDRLDFDEYFADIVGVSIPKKKNLTKILLRFSDDRYPYIISKPLHESQKIKGNNMVEISVIPNNELESLLLSFGSDVEVISPENYRKDFANKIIDTINNYLTSAERLHKRD